VLIDGEDTPAPIHGTNWRAAAAPRASAAKRRASAKAPAAAEDSAWLALRTRVRDRLAQRELKIADLAAELQLSPTTVTVAVGRKSAPTKTMMLRLEGWLAEALAVAPTELTFRRTNPNGAATAA
jgi:hypothetical protein